MTRSSSTSTRWCFTVNNPSTEEVQGVKRMVQVPECLIATVGLERGAQGTPHLQGFAVFLHEVTRSAMEEALGGRTHLEKMRGRVAQNRAYCRKEGNVIAEKGADDEKTKPMRKKAMWSGVLLAAKTMEPDEFQEHYPEHWMLRRAAVERLMIEAQVKKATIWEGNLQSKKVWL
jgi:hypothetical protein